MEPTHIDDFDNNMPTTPKPQRTTGFAILLILTFIGSGFMALSTFCQFAFFDIMNSEEVKQIFSQFPGAVETLEKVLSGGRYMFLSEFFCYIASVSGAVLMWNFKRIGFHFYTVAQILLLILPVVFIDRSMIAYGNIIIAGIFIALYASFYKKMGIKL